MEGRIVKEFHDKYDYRKVYKVGDLVDFSVSRFEELNALGLVEAVKVTAAEVEPASDADSAIPEQKQERKRRVKKND